MTKNEAKKFVLQHIVNTVQANIHGDWINKLQEYSDHNKRKLNAILNEELYHIINKKDRIK